MMKLSASTILLALALAACSGQTLPATAEPATATEPPPAATQTPPPSTETATPPTETATTTSQDSSTVSFTGDVLPILEASCINCHGVNQVKEGLDLTTYEGIIAGSFNGSVITPGNAADSYLVQQIVEGEMPKRGLGLTDEQVKIITDWVNQGALNN